MHLGRATCHPSGIRMKINCPTCKSYLYIPDDKQSLRKCSVLCSHCHSTYLASAGDVVGAWLGYSNHHRVIYHARIHLQNGSIKTVELEKLIGIGTSIILLTPLKGVGKLNPILLIETNTEITMLLIHPRQQMHKVQVLSAMATGILILLLGIVLQGSMGAIVAVAMVSSLVVAITIKRIYRGEEKNLQLRHRLLLIQQLLRRSDDWGQRFCQLHSEFSSLYSVTQQLQPYAKNHVFEINSLSTLPRERRYFDNRYHILSELIECYLHAKSLVDTSIPAIQSTAEVPLDLNEKLLEFSQQIEYLEQKYRINS